MTRTSAIAHLPAPGRGGLRLDSSKSAPRQRTNQQRQGLRWSAPGELAAGALLLVAWALIWAFFIAGVVEPAAGMQARAARPRLDVSTTLPIARSGADPGPVDTTGRAP
jgi:hypothetical protein